MSSLPDNVVRLIVGGRDGRLTTPGGEEVPVKVFERGEELIVVLMAFPAGELDREPLQLEYSSIRGLVRFHGRAKIEAHDTVSFHLDETPDVVQRREFVRVDAANRWCSSVTRTTRCSAGTRSRSAAAACS